ncbi:MAG: hypothetical protein ACFFD2_02530, partial [Promethearchaeota archaeon]
MSRHKKSVISLLFLLLMSPFIAYILVIPNKIEFVDLSDNPLNTSTWNSEFRDWYCISDQPPLFNDANDTSWMARIAIDSQDYLHVVWADDTDGTAWGTDYEIFYSFFNSIAWSTPIAISPGVGNWNSGTSWQPSIAIDSQDNLHVVWSDSTLGWWTNSISDFEILYSNYTLASGWSNPICISDNISLWNDGLSEIPFIAIDSNDDLHVVWSCNSSGWWKNNMKDSEIFYVKRTNNVWGNVIPISDNSTLWNNDTSHFPSIAVDNNDNVHVVWQDETNDTQWGNDMEILYRNYTIGVGWGPFIGLSGVGINSWNNDFSEFPIIAIDPNTDLLHVVWQDNTSSPNEWGYDYEIFYSRSTDGVIWTNATALSGIGVNSWNNDGSWGPWITIDNISRIHVVWHDDTDSTLEWGTDREIFYSNSTDGVTWFNATCLSDQPDYSNMPNTGFYWQSEEPCIAYDSTNFVHVVWWDDSPATFPPPQWTDWDGELEVFYTSNYYSVGTPVLQPITPNPSTTGSISLNWTASAYAAYYKIYQSTSNITIVGLGSATLIGTTRSTIYNDNIGSDGTYYYAIVAHNVGGDSSPSNCESVVVVIVVLIPPNSNNPSDQILEKDEVASIPWILTDALGAGYYRVLINNTPGPWYTWTNNTLINFPIDTSTVGVFNYTIEYNNSNGIFGIPNTVIITITTPPNSNNPSDQILEKDEVASIPWILTDALG